MGPKHGRGQSFGALRAVLSICDVRFSSDCFSNRNFMGMEILGVNLFFLGVDSMLRCKNT